MTLGGASGLNINSVLSDQNALLQVADGFTFASGSTVNLGTTTVHFF